MPANCLQEEVTELVDWCRREACEEEPAPLDKQTAKDIARVLTAQTEQIKRLREALTTIADSDMPVCNSCEGEGNRYADGKAHYYSEHAPTIPCPECYGVGRIPDLTANDMRELAEEALKEASHD